MSTHSLYFTSCSRWCPLNAPWTRTSKRSECTPEYGRCVLCVVRPGEGNAIMILPCCRMHSCQMHHRLFFQQEFYLKTWGSSFRHRFFFNSISIHPTLPMTKLKRLPKTFQWLNKKAEALSCLLRHWITLWLQLMSCAIIVSHSQRCRLRTVHSSYYFQTTK